MFKYLTVSACLALFIATAINALPVEREDVHKEFIPILSSEITKHEDGSYQLHYEGGDGTQRKEEATVVDAGTEDEALEVKGSYKYINAEGEEVEVFYTAGVNGFVPYGSIINKEISAAAEAAKNFSNDDKYDVQGKKIAE